jgi:hypothetical protein
MARLNPWEKFPWELDEIPLFNNLSQDELQQVFDDQIIDTGGDPDDQETIVAHAQAVNAQWLEEGGDEALLEVSGER